MPIRDAKEVIEKWFANMPVAGAFVKEMRAYPATHGGVTVTTHFGRKRRYPLITSQNQGGIENEAINFPISSTASDCTLLSCIELIFKHKIDERFEAHIINEVHDSIVIEVPYQNAYAVANIMHDTMCSIPPRELETDVPFKADIEVGMKYGEVGAADMDYLKALSEGAEFDPDKLKLKKKH